MEDSIYDRWFYLVVDLVEDEFTLFTNEEAALSFIEEEKEHRPQLFLRKTMTEGMP